MSVDYNDANECRCEAMRIDDQIVELRHQARRLRDRAAFLDQRDTTNPLKDTKSQTFRHS